LAPVSPRRGHCLDGDYFDGDRAGEPRPEMFMTDSNAWHNPSEDYPPTRPGKLVFLGAVAVGAVAVAIANWAAISSFAHIPQIKTALGF
jgi:hypothetical protein